ncbi:hypothetical protein VNO78_12295 [Psophocarpus tetragonolobus]|uniref:D-fructose-1,6-bisphosphate 1-phosphohydrolase n=1 Tax=Psophocarpus tetragonolobus TaxID=3891 RepID=A0AAN9SQQ1_PSOTE
MERVINSTRHASLQNEIILSSLQKSGKVVVMASKENDALTRISDDGPYVVVTDPIDGSRNIDTSSPTCKNFGLRQYIDIVRQGKGRYPKKYSARYICSLVADLHRTLLYGGVAMNPRDHLRVVYETNPLSFIVEQAGGRGPDGKNRILSLQPVKLHQRLPLFMGSLDGRVRKL